MKILLIEDEALILHFLEQRLKKENYSVDISRDGNHALKQICKKKYELIITDLMLPCISGFDLISKIRSDKKNTETPILIVSALSSENTIIEALSIGANDFLPKPFGINVLMAKVKLLTGGHTLLQAS